MSHHYLRNWHEMTGSEFQRLDPEKVIVTVACSPMEVHGPHLPVVTDSIEAESLTKRTIDLLHERHPEITFLRLLPIYTAADVLPHRGSLMFRSSTIVRVMNDLGRTLCKQGFKDIWVSNFHGGPRHFVAIEQSCHVTNQRYGGRMISLFSLLAKRLTEGTSNLSNILGRIEGLTPEELDGDSHGGAIETSMLLHIMGDRVDPCYATLPRRTVDIKLQEQGEPPKASKPGKSSPKDLFRGFKASLKYFEEETYAGKPSIASPEIGRKIIDVLAELSADTLSQVWTRQIHPDECHSPVWPARRIFLSRTASSLFERAVKYRNPIF